ncbi:hypothetical protein [Natranaeroarchaeum aerophilus]|uniref:Uncharacterized protein n=1 Tax=Natranaeroarchaeum aerophilus TaxID=2917711 RepID=A0AAE3K488_9EURY|nr:hypothetical protein [Natranaeroarchaeum aerophilus]MCL9812425.1 hypothetical protein [Natranaeroarchaeum aerophilus]
MDTIRDLAPGDAWELVALYEEYDWWEDRSVEDVRRALAETEVAVGIEADGDLVATARVLTDYTYYANVFDVPEGGVEEMVRMTDRQRTPASSGAGGCQVFERVSADHA